MDLFAQPHFGENPWRAKSSQVKAWRRAGEGLEEEGDHDTRHHATVGPKRSADINVPGPGAPAPPPFPGLASAAAVCIMHTYIYIYMMFVLGIA
jgi:hypothetical protein